MEDLNKRLEHLQEMVEIPQLFVADFFFGLRNEIDKVYLKKETDGTPSVKDEWMKIISRIEAFEKELSNSIKKQLNVAFTEEANKLILEIFSRDVLNDKLKIILVFCYKVSIKRCNLMIYDKVSTDRSIKVIS